MSAAPQDASPRTDSAAHSTDDHDTMDRPRRFFRHHGHDLDLYSQSLEISSSLHDDLPTPSAPTYAHHTASAHSTPMTSPSTAYSSLFPGSLSSATSESAPCAEFRSDFGLLTSGSPVHGSASSRSSHPVSPRSRSTTESDAHPSPSRYPPKTPSRHVSLRPSTAPHAPSGLATTSNATEITPEHHTRSHSRLTVSIKNLLSRPAVPTPPRFSLSSLSTPSESDASARSFQISSPAGKWSMTPRKPRPPNLEVSESPAAAAIPTPSRSSNSAIDAHRRYASDAVAKIYDARTGSGPPMSQDSFGISVQNMPPVIARGRELKTRNVLRRRPSGSAKLFKGRERGANSPSRQHQTDADHRRTPPKPSRSAEVPLTPAGAVVEAYKQQKLHRDEIPSSPMSTDARMSPRPSLRGSHDREYPEHPPYSNVSGSSSEYHMRSGGPGDRSDGKYELTRTTSRTIHSHQSSTPDSCHRSITRKISSRWRKAKGGGVTPEDSPSHNRGHSKGRPSLQELWASDKFSMRSTGRSMDSTPNTSDRAWSGSMEGHARPGSEKGNGTDGGKIWRLMRRISTGGLRDRFNDDKIVPPVPAIPKELLERVNQGEHGNEPVSRHQPSSSRDKDHSRVSAVPRNMTARVAVASTSSKSSDVASMQFFHKTHSARSSISSYGEAVVAPHTQEIALDQHIIAPIEQLRLDEDHVEDGKPGPAPRSPRRSVSVPAGLRKVGDTEDEHDPLPSPRRPTWSGESPSRASSRPPSTSAPASWSPHASLQSQGGGVGQARMADGIVSLSPPPRPQRNSKRIGSMTGSPSLSMLARQVERSGIRQIDRTPSARSDMTARPESPESGRSGDQDASPRTRTQVTFRELGARRPPLSEREKMDIWNDLLDRSEKAGGTLHLNGDAELMSDNIRFSTHSEI